MSSIYDADLMHSFPAALRSDPALAALGRVIADELQQLMRETLMAVLYTNIDTLPEEVLDLLAYDFKVDWWDYGYTLEEKRATLRASWSVHRRLGTKYAVQTAISAIYEHTTVREWFEYDGKPYMFRLLIDASYDHVDPQKHQQVLDRVDFYKNLRSHLEQVEYVVNPQGKFTVTTGLLPCGFCMRIFSEVKNYVLE